VTWLWAWLMRTDLFTRMLVLVAVATAPALLVLIYLQSELRASQRDHMSEEALRQAELLNGDLASIVEGARQMTVAISRIDPVHRLDPSCAAQLVELRAVLTNYIVLAVLSDDGRVVCTAGLDTVATLRTTPSAELAASLQNGSFETGTYTRADDEHGAMLPFRLPFTSADGRHRGVVVAGLSLAWLAEHLTDFKRPEGSTVGISDRRGTTLLRFPGNEQALGKPMPQSAMALVQAPHRGNAVITGFDGVERLIGYVPINEAPLGLFASVGLSMPELTADIDRAAWRGYGLIGVGGMLSLWLAMLVAERFVRRPTEQLLRAAQRWSKGDLAVRVDTIVGARSEFSRLERAFNLMAEALGRQRSQLEELNMTLEARVAARTADLRQSRDQLQVTMAEHARSEASLRQAQKLQVVGQLAGGIAHDFNNLLTGVIGALDVLRGRLDAEDARSHRLIDTALLAADRGGRLTAQLLSFSRRQRLLPVPTDLNAVVHGMLDLMSSTLGRDITILVELDDALWPAIVDPHQMEQVILNLAVNARDAMSGKGELRIGTGRAIRCTGGTLVTTTRPGPSLPLHLDRESNAASERAADGAYAAIWVSDGGTGMSAEILARVFEPFFTTKQPGSHPGKQPGQGSGLGLSQVHGLAAQSGGEVQIESVPGVGTTVTLLLPRAQTAPVAAMAGRSLTVLMVDDDHDVRRMTGEMLAELGHRPLLASDADAALELLNGSQCIDLLLTDMVMPGLSGTELISRAQTLRPGLRCLLVTGLTDVAGLSDGAGSEASCPILHKPFSLAELAQVLRAEPVP